MRSRERERRRWWWWSGWKDKTAISGWREREGGREEENAEDRNRDGRWEAEAGCV